MTSRGQASAAGPGSVGTSPRRSAIRDGKVWALPRHSGESSVCTRAARTAKPATPGGARPHPRTPAGPPERVAPKLFWETVPAGTAVVQRGREGVGCAQLPLSVRRSRPEGPGAGSGWESSFKETR